MASVPITWPIDAVRHLGGRREGPAGIARNGEAEAARSMAMVVEEVPDDIDGAFRIESQRGEGGVHVRDGLRWGESPPAVARARVAHPIAVERPAGAFRPGEMH